jgi:hypothetical protein
MLLHAQQLAGAAAEHLCLAIAASSSPSRFSSVGFA